MPERLVGRGLPVGALITIANDQLSIRDEQAREVQFPSSAAPEVVGAIIVAILDSQPVGLTTTVAGAIADDLLRDAASALTLAMEHNEKQS